MNIHVNIPFALAAGLAGALVLFAASVSAQQAYGIDTGQPCVPFNKLPSNISPDQLKDYYGRCTGTMSTIPPTPDPAEVYIPTPLPQISGFIFPESHRQTLNQGYVCSLPAHTLRLARNEIFARKGRYFKSPDLNKYFHQKPWYAPYTWSPSLTSTELRNIDIIKGCE